MAIGFCVRGLKLEFWDSGLACRILSGFRLYRFRSFMLLPISKSRGQNNNGNCARCSILATKGEVCRILKPSLMAFGLLCSVGAHEL